MTSSAKDGLRWLLALVLGTAMALHTPSAHSQKIVKPDREQLRLLKKGVQASKQGDHDQAIKFYTAVIALGPLNIAFMNLGRAHQKKGDCLKALALFEEAAAAPTVRNPSPARIQKAIETYRAEMPDGCRGEVTIVCNPPALDLLIDGQPAQCQTPISLTHGKHTLKATSGDQHTERDFEVVGAERAEITVGLSIDAKPKPPDDTSSESQSSSARFWGWGLVGAGSVAILTGAIGTLQVSGLEEEIERLGKRDPIPSALADDALDRADTLDNLQLYGYGLGISMATIGALILYYNDDDPNEGEPAIRVAPTASPEQLGINIEVGF